jgi:hypothetical protein
MGSVKSKVRRSAAVYGIGIAVAYLAGVATSRFWQPVLASVMTPGDAARARADSLRDGIDRDSLDGQSLDGKRNDRPENRASRAVTTDRIRGAFQFSDPIRGQLEFARLIEDANASNIAGIRAMFDEFNRSSLTYDAQWRMLWHQWGTIDPQAALRRSPVRSGKTARAIPRTVTDGSPLRGLRAIRQGPSPRSDDPERAWS